VDKNSDKPVLRTRRAFDFEECTRWVEKRLGYNLRDTLGSNQHYSDWCKMIGEETFVCSQEQYKRYKNHPDGSCKRPEYRDHWHFLEEHLEGLSNGSEISIGSWLLEFGNEWQTKITQAYIDEFGDNATYWTEW